MEGEGVPVVDLVPNAAAVNTVAVRNHILVERGEGRGAIKKKRSYLPVTNNNDIVTLD